MTIPRQDRPTGIGTSTFAVRNVRPAAAWSGPGGTGDSHAVRKNPLVRALRLVRRDPCPPTATAQDRFIAVFPLVPILADIYSPRCAREDGRARITAFEACERTYSQVRDMIRARQRHGRRCAAAYKEIMNKAVSAGPDTCRYPLAGARRERTTRSPVRKAMCCWRVRCGSFPVGASWCGRVFGGAGCRGGSAGGLGGGVASGVPVLTVLLLVVVVAVLSWLGSGRGRSRWRQIGL